MFHGRLDAVSLCHFTWIGPLLKVTRTLSAQGRKISRGKFRGYLLDMIALGEYAKKIII